VTVETTLSEGGTHDPVAAVAAPLLSLYADEDDGEQLDLKGRTRVLGGPLKNKNRRHRAKQNW
jgi:hypothetical protein